MKFQKLTFKIQVIVKNAKQEWLKGAGTGVIAEEEIEFIVPESDDDGFVSYSVVNSISNHKRSLTDEVIETKSELLSTEECSKKEYKAFMQRNGWKTRR